VSECLLCKENGLAVVAKAVASERILGKREWVAVKRVCYWDVILRELMVRSCREKRGES
jgi:hypothetical protein